MNAIVFAYLAAIVAANLAVATFGPSITVLTAFLLIGFDLTARDRLHEAWEGRKLPVRMALLIATGGAISYVLNAGAGQIAIASTVAFTVAAALDSVVYSLLGERGRLLRINGSNVVGAAADSLLFPTLAFGSILPAIVIGQLVAKVAGGFLWSLVLGPRRWTAKRIREWDARHERRANEEADAAWGEWRHRSPDHEDVARQVTK